MTVLPQAVRICTNIQSSDLKFPASRIQNSDSPFWLSIGTLRVKLHVTNSAAIDNRGLVTDGGKHELYFTR